ncbi:hypothetical protein AGOR_G00210080 [Albula goreensis]|uniref:Uncharacterized protein n=1 Tax=Albula goreensis TaxID=1534307 RepID=A0A8T3CS25_9TELE|nr:hypothetical protein AGOR_G00210080 [Albula goreensis]
MLSVSVPAPIPRSGFCGMLRGNGGAPRGSASGTGLYIHPDPGRLLLKRTAGLWFETGVHPFYTLSSKRTSTPGHPEDKVIFYIYIL